MDGVTARSLTPFERKAYTFYGMLLNAYRDEEDMEPPVQKLSLQNGGDFTDDDGAVFATDFVCKQCTRGEEGTGREQGGEEFLRIHDNSRRLKMSFCFIAERRFS